jgi:hypothetical protein
MCIGVQYLLEYDAFLPMLLSELIWSLYLCSRPEIQLLRLAQVFV